MKVNTLNTQSNSPSFGSKILINLKYLPKEKASGIRNAVLEEIGYGIGKYPYKKYTYIDENQGFKDVEYYQDVFVGNRIKQQKGENDIMIATGSENIFLEELGYVAGWKHAEAKLQQIDNLIIQKVKVILNRFVSFIDNEMIIHNVDFDRKGISERFGMINKSTNGSVEIVDVVAGHRYSEFFKKQADGTYLQVSQ